MSKNPSYSIEIDQGSVDLMVDMFEDVVDEFIDELTEEVEHTWRKLASPALNTSREKYFKGLKVSREGNAVVMSLTGELAKSVENGQSSFDLKPGFLKGALYRVIPLVSSTGVTKFRTVSHTSSGWIHPGLTPRNIMGAVQAEIEQTVLGEVFSRVLSRSKI